MSLDEYEEPKGAYYTPALVADFDSAKAAEDAVGTLRKAGFTTRDIQVARKDSRVTIIVSEPTPGMLEDARRLLEKSAASDVRPYGSEPA